jgi:acetyl esterase/lipase
MPIRFRPLLSMLAAALIVLLSMGAVALSDTAATNAEPKIGAKAVLEDRYPERRISFPRGVVGLPDLTYSTVTGFRPLTLDLYLPATHAAGGAAVIIYVHGGGWINGHTRHSGAFENWQGVLASLAGKGYVVASLNYRLSGEAPSPAAEQDIKSAIRWLRTNAARFGIDKRRIGIWGGSAGGQLAALAGTSCGVKALEPPVTDPKAPVESECVQSVVAWYGVFDVAPLVSSGTVPANVARYLGCTQGACTDDKVALASAIRYVDRSDPPFLLIHGALDKTVAVSQSEKFHAALQANAVKSQLLILPDVDHSFVGGTAEATRDASLRALQATIDFFETTLTPTH